VNRGLVALAVESKMTSFKYSKKFWVLLVYVVLLSASFIGRIQGQENSALTLTDYAGTDGIMDFLFPETDPLSLQVIVASLFWFLVGLGAEFTHRYPKWHRIIDLLFIVFVIVVIFIIYQQHITGQLSPNAIFRIFPYLLFMLIGVTIGYVLRKLKERETNNSCSGAHAETT